MVATRRKNFEIVFVVLLAVCTHQCLPYWVQSQNNTNLSESPFDATTDTALLATLSHENTGLLESRKKVCGNTYPDWIYLNETRKCYKVGFKGPCRGSMVVVITDEVPGIGKCGCTQQRCGRPRVYWPEKNRCYYIFDQGPCAEGQWIVPSTAGVSKCQNNPCLHEYNRVISSPERSARTFHHNYVFPYENRCYITKTENDVCPKGKWASFAAPTPRHTCHTKYSCASSEAAGSFPRPKPTRTRPGCPNCRMSGGAFNPCPGGEKADFYGGCEPETEWD